MGLFRAAIRRLEGFVFVEGYDRDIDEELQSHIDMCIDDNLAAGMSPEAARRDAYTRFGRYARVKVNCREVRGAGALETYWQDLRYGCRVLARRPGFSAVVVLTLALGIGANTAVFSVFDAVLLRPLPFPEAERLVVLWQQDESGRTTHVAEQNLADWRARSRSFEHVSAYAGQWAGPSTVTGGAEPVRAKVAYVYRDFFETLGVSAVVGRTFAPEEWAYGSDPGVVVGHRFWQDQLGADPGIEGRRLVVDGDAYRVLGVMPPGFAFPGETELWVAPEQSSSARASRTAHNVVGIARLRPGTDLGAARREMGLLAQQLAAEHPEIVSEGIAVVPLAEELVGSVRHALMVLLAGAGLVLLVACVNVGNLSLARALERRSEVAVRIALGATRGRIARQLLTESVLLSLAGTALGLLLAVWLVRVLVALGPESIPRLEEVAIDRTALVFALALMVVSVTIFGVGPAWRAMRPDLYSALRTGSGRTSASGQALRSALVVCQVALTVVLLVGAGLLGRSLLEVASTDPGFDPERVLTAQISLPSSVYDSEGRTRSFYGTLLERLEALPEITAAGAINNLPMSGVSISGAFDVEEATAPRGSAGFRIVTPGYFHALSIPLLRGRLFSAGDSEHSAPVAIVSERTAMETWPGEDPIGKRIRSGMDNRGELWMTVVGVVGDVRHKGAEAAPAADLYVPLAQRPARAREMTLVLESHGDPSALGPAIRHEVRSLDPHIPVAIDSMEQTVARSMARRTFTALLLGFFAVLALALAGVGIYGVMSCAVAQSTREIAIRLALGAQVREVRALVLGQSLLLACLGMALGLVGAIAATRLVRSLLFGIAPTDPATFAAVAALVVLVSIAASVVPARRATQVDPSVVLRYE